MLSRHPSPQPDSCEVCKHASDHNLDSESEHALTRLATMMMVESLRESGGTAQMQRLATSWDVGVGPVHLMDPRHWHWALFFESSLRIQLVEGTRGQ